MILMVNEQDTSFSKLLSTCLHYTTSEKQTMHMTPPTIATTVTNLGRLQQTTSTWYCPLQKQGARQNRNARGSREPDDDSASVKLTDDAEVILTSLRQTPSRCIASKCHVGANNAASEA